MKLAKRIVSFVVLLALCMGIIGCGQVKGTKNGDEKLNIVTTIFPYYDITRAIVGDVEGISLEMAVKPGQDSHAFEPTPNEVIKIQESDLFIYNGGEIENWVETVLDSYQNDKQIKVEMLKETKGIELLCAVGHSHGHNEDSHEEHAHGEVDPHIWTSPVNAMAIVETICDYLCQMIPEETETFKNNAESYLTQLKSIDMQIREIAKNATNNELIFADQFPLIYFANEYGFEYYAAFSGCGHDMEPSVQDICKLIDIVEQENINVVFHLELSSQNIANAICDDTKAIKLQFNSCHNVSQKQFDEGITYVDLMKENVEGIRQACD